MAWYLSENEKDVSAKVVEKGFIEWLSFDSQLKILRYMKKGVLHRMAAEDTLSTQQTNPMSLDLQPMLNTNKTLLLFSVFKMFFIKFTFMFSSN